MKAEDIISSFRSFSVVKTSIAFVPLLPSDPSTRKDLPSKMVVGGAILRRYPEVSGDSFVSENVFA